MMTFTNVRPSPIAGTWYTADPKRLSSIVNHYINDAVIPPLPGEVIALVSPHAGYQYSGAVAGHAFKTIQGQSFDQVVVISPMHQYYPHPFITTAHDAYHTPLGDLPVAKNTISEISRHLQAHTGSELHPVAYDREHALEIELPFLQCALKGGFDLIPIMLRDQTSKNSRILGGILAEVLGDKSCLFVASSDLSHFYRENIANRLDHNILTALEDFSPEGLFEVNKRGEGQACGLAAMATILWAARAVGADQVTLLKYDTSAATTGDQSSVVGYGAAAITRPIQPTEDMM
jgi:AmmeMemoRadiSam system protein B